MPNSKLLIIDNEVDDLFFQTAAFGKSNGKTDIISFQNAEDTFCQLKNLTPEKLPILIVSDETCYRLGDLS